MATLKQVIKAHRAIAAATEHYRELLRDALASGVPQVEIARELGVTRETLRKDALTDEKRQAIREADAARKARLRERAKAAS